MKQCSCCKGKIKGWSFGCSEKERPELDNLCLKCFDKWITNEGKRKQIGLLIDYFRLGNVLKAIRDYIIRENFFPDGRYSYIKIEELENKIRIEIPK
jgi:hypothetical protein